jgi:hypothetical protein
MEHVPKHTLAKTKYDFNSKRSLQSYTGEDTEQTTLNLPLTASLRDHRSKQKLSDSGAPPTWYEKDVENYNSKFDLAVK